MTRSIVLWLLLAISTISIFSDIARASSASVQCLRADQMSLLLELRNSLVFDASASSKLVHWDRSADSWNGVTCEDGLVVGLDLSSESISGGIDGSSSLFRLEYLRSLNLASDYFYSSAIPSGLGNLSRLVHLNLSDAGFVGKIPAELSRLTKLRTLDLSGLEYVEKPHLRSLIGKMGELRELYLDGVNVSAEGSEWCDTLSSSVPKLEVLSMWGCSLSGPIHASLKRLANLSVIRLDGNDLSGPVPSLNFSSLKTLSLWGCGLQGEFPQEVFQVKTLETLDLTDNPDLQVSFPDFPMDSSLKTLVLSETNILGRLPDSIGNLGKLSILDLHTCGLSGSIPSSMKNLSKLTYLDLSSNNLTGSVPPFAASRNLTKIVLSNNALTGQISSLGWQELLNLEHLDLQNNSFEGNIPPTLFSLPRLVRIFLSENRFNGQLNIDLNVSSYQLGELDLGTNLLRGPIPASIFKLQGLGYLSLSHNNFSGSMHMDALQEFRDLDILDLSYSGLSISTMASTSAAASSFRPLAVLRLASCQLRKFPQFLANWSKLISLDLSNNYIRGEIPQWIWTQKNLAFLNLSYNFFEEFETPLYNVTSSLTLVDLHSNMLRGSMPPLPRGAGYLDFSSNNITSFIPDNIGDYLSTMSFFSLSNNNFHGSIPKSICKTGHLEVLDLSHNHLNGTIPGCLMMASLKVLNLRNNHLSGNILQNIPATCGLKTLDMSENLLQGQIPLSLANCPMLEVVNIGDNLIEGTFPCHFKAMSSLRVLVLRSNKLHGEIGCLHGPRTWQKLQIVDLSSNDFGGTLSAGLLTSWEAMKANVDFNYLHQSVPWSGVPYQDTVIVTFKGVQLELVKILTVFTSIDFSGNRLEGPIPDALGDLKALRFLNLSHNAISGSIPSFLGDLHQLESLDMSSNYLNRTIPAHLANLHFLSFLNLSNNQLVGSIPTSGQFLTFSESSFEGNPGLYGLQLNKSCSIPTNGTDEAGDDGDDDDSERKWFYLGIPLGFVVGFWAFCGPLAFIRSWRLAYYRFWDKVLSRHACP